jgi:excinuclease UvrABC ATPase subunit
VEVEKALVSAVEEEEKGLFSTTVQSEEKGFPSTAALEEEEDALVLTAAVEVEKALVSAVEEEEKGLFSTTVQSEEKGFPSTAALEEEDALVLTAAVEEEVSSTVDAMEGRKFSSKNGFSRCAAVAGSGDNVSGGDSRLMTESRDSVRSTSVRGAVNRNFRRRESGRFIPRGWTCGNKEITEISI